MAPTLTTRNPLLMCTVCGLPSTHSNLTQTLGYLTLFSFTLTTFLGAWWIVTSARAKYLIKRAYKKILKNKSGEVTSSQTQENTPEIEIPTNLSK